MQAPKTSVSEYDDSCFAPSASVTPQSLQPVVRFDADTSRRELTIMRWGLVPFWSKDGNAACSTINARAETVTTSPLHREAFKCHRCLIPADWFYEWKMLDATTKQPYAIALKDGALFALAGLWERWTDEVSNKILETYAIVTTDPNALVESIDNRMPVILKPRDYERWLAPGDPRQPPVDLLRPYDAEEMMAWSVEPDLGDVETNWPDLPDSFRMDELEKRG